MPEEAPSTQACFGLDIGAVNLVAARDDGELLRNEDGGTSTGTVVSFHGKERHLGEAATDSLKSNGRNTATAVGRLALMPYAPLAASPLAAHWQFTHSAHEGGAFEMDAQYNGAQRRFSGVQLLGALLAKVRATSGAGESPCVALVLPPCVEAGTCQEDKEAALAFARAAVLDAAEIGGWKPVALPTAMEAAAVALSRKYPAAEAPVEGEEPGARHVMLLDMGAATTNVAFIAVDAEPGQQLVADSGDAQLGCVDFDAAVWSHFANLCKTVHKIEVTRGSRGGQRLLDACERARKLLSTLPQVTTTAENLGDGVDVALPLSRDELGVLTAGCLARLRALLDGALAKAPPLSGVELLGGGSRMPAVQAVVAESLAASQAGAAVAAELRFGAKLDDASLAVGAALIARAALDGGAAPPEAPGRLEAPRLEAAQAEEAAMVEADAAEAQLSELRNEIEGLVLEARGRRGRTHGELIDGGRLEPLLEAAEEWFYSEEGEAADVEALKAKLATLQLEVGEACASFLTKAAEDKQQEESQLEEAAAGAAAERDAKGEDDEDHDTRRLKFPDRLRMVLKNKEEGTELFKGSNFRPAAARYNKALTHATKFIDLSPEQRLQVDAAKVSLNLNLAQCWLKITDADNHLTQAIRCCDEVLVLDADNVKALYRRAMALEAKGDYDQAKVGLKRAAELAPDDSAVPKLMARVDAQLKRQADKEKKMYSKMFN